MNDASQWRIDLARKVSRVYESQPAVRMSAMGGSAARGQADAYSDIDMAVYWDKVDAEWLREPPLKGEGVTRFIHLELEGANQGLILEQYFLRDAKIDVISIPLGWLDREIASVVEGLDTTPERQEVPEGMTTAAILSGEDLYRRYLDRLAAYPDALAEKMVREHFQFMPPWVLEQHGLVRDDLFAYHELLTASLKNVVGVLAGMNRQYVCLAQGKLKRIEHVLAGMPIAPPDAAGHARALLERRGFAEHYPALILGTIDLVEKHMPSVDTAAARALFAFPMGPANGMPAVEFEAA